MPSFQFHAFQVYMNVSSNPWLAVFDKILEIREKKLSSGLDIIWEASRDAFHLNQVCVTVQLTEVLQRDTDFEYI